MQVGFRERIFSDVAGALGSFAAAAEFAFGTIVQRTMSYPGRVRFYYGHPDVFNKLHCMTRVSAEAGQRRLRLHTDTKAHPALAEQGSDLCCPPSYVAGWHWAWACSRARLATSQAAPSENPGCQRMSLPPHPDHIPNTPTPHTAASACQGGVSKATRGLHVSEDIFCGFNHTLRGARIKYREYISCGKASGDGAGGRWGQWQVAAPLVHCFSVQKEITPLCSSSATDTGVAWLCTVQ